MGFEARKRSESRASSEEARQRTQFLETLGGSLVVLNNLVPASSVICWFSGLIAFWSACLSSRQELWRIIFFCQFIALQCALPGGTCLENLRCPLHSFWPRSIGGSVRFFFEAYFQGFESIFSHPPHLHPIACSWFKLLLEPAPKEMRHLWRDQRKIFPTSCFSGQLSAFQQDAADLSVLLKWRQYVQMYFCTLYSDLFWLYDSKYVQSCWSLIYIHHII